LALDQSILSDFVTESKSLLEDLSTVVASLEAESPDFPEEDLKDFALKIDRIMGAVKTIVQLDDAPAGRENQGLIAIGKLAEACKSLGYKAAEKKKAALMPFFAAFWAETIELISELLDHVDNREKTAELVKTHSPVLQNRLKWLLSKIDQ
jgi:hypothetical protein